MLASVASVLLPLAHASSSANQRANRPSALEILLAKRSPTHTCDDGEAYAACDCSRCWASAMPWLPRAAALSKREATNHHSLDAGRGRHRGPDAALVVSGGDDGRGDLEHGEFGFSVGRAIQCLAPPLLASVVLVGASGSVGSGVAGEMAPGYWPRQSPRSASSRPTRQDCQKSRRATRATTRRRRSSASSLYWRSSASRRRRKVLVRGGHRGRAAAPRLLRERGAAGRSGAVGLTWTTARCAFPLRRGAPQSVGLSASSVFAVASAAVESGLRMSSGAPPGPGTSCARFLACFEGGLRGEG